MNVPDGERFAANGFINHNTTLARIYARAMLCENLDKSDPEPCNKCDTCTSILNDTSMVFTEQDAASQGGIDQVRRIVDGLPFAVLGAAKRIYLFDECHRMSKDAQDVLLKPLEERKMIGMFCTTEPEKVRGAIRSRCEEYAIRKVTREDILVRMKRILEAEKVEYEDDGVLIVIDFSGGHVRDVVSRLEMIAQLGPVTVESVREHLNLSVVSTYYDILLCIPTDTKKALQLVDTACDRVTPEEVASGIAEAAMNSFRLANGMNADFTFADSKLGGQVHNLYGSNLIQVTEQFIKSRYTTKVGLICDITLLAQRFNSGSFAAPQTFFQAQPIQPPPVHTSPSPVAPSQPAPAVVATPSPIAPPEPAVATQRQPEVESEKVIPVGNLGSDDPEALTEFDTEVINKNPKSSKKGSTSIALDTRSKEGRDLISPEVWKRDFQEMWLRGANG